jgi:hypothetical protein
VHYNPYVPETRVVAKYNITDTSSPTALRTSYESNIFKSMEIDGVMLDGLVTEYIFDTVGVHTVKYELYDETKLGYNAPVFNNSNLVECVIPDNVTSIGVSAFVYCTSLTSIDIPDGVTSIGVSAFNDCTSLTSCTIGSGVTSIKDSTFQYCTNLTSVTIGSGVTSIEGNGFGSCTSLTNIVSNAMIAPTITNYTFSNIKTGGTLYVPQGSTGYDTWINYLSGWTKVEQ